MSESRLELLLLELDGFSWDIVVVTESWREAKREVVHHESGHVWYGSGGCKGRCGVGFLVNSRLANPKFVPARQMIGMRRFKEETKT